MNTKQNLEHSYKTFIDRKQPFDFFKGLAEYLEYIFSVPILKKEFDKQLAERRVLYKQIEVLENKTRQELDQAKEKLFALIKKIKVDIVSFNRYQTWAFPSGETNILQEMEAYENKGALGSVFVSDEIERHLFDIAANLLKAGRRKELSEFIVSSKEYAIYYRRINGSSQYIYIGNQDGNFIFSKTWPERWEKVANFERERVLKLWGSFETLLQFYTAYKLAASKNLDLSSPPMGGTENAPWFGAAKERVKIFSMARELQRLTENRMDFYSRVAQDYKTRKSDELKNLKYIDLKTATETVHNRLLVVAGKESEKETKPKRLNTKPVIIIDSQKGIYDATHTNRLYEISGKRLKTVYYLCKNNIASLSDLVACTGQMDTLIVKEINEVNINFRKCLKIKKDIITHSKTGGGYRLNRDDFEIKTST